MAGCSIISSTMGGSTTAAAAASSPRSVHGGEEEEQDHLFDAASNLGGSSYFDAASPDAHQQAADAQQDAADAHPPAEDSPPVTPAAADRAFVVNVQGVTLTSEARAEAAVAVAVDPPAAEDAFSGAALGGSVGSSAASFRSHIRMVAAPVPAQVTSMPNIAITAVSCRAVYLLVTSVLVIVHMHVAWCLAGQHRSGGRGPCCGPRNHLPVQRQPGWQPLGGLCQQRR